MTTSIRFIFTHSTLLLSILLVTSSAMAKITIRSDGVVQRQPVTIELEIDDDFRISGTYTYGYGNYPDPIPLTGLLQDSRIYMETVEDEIVESFEGEVKYYEDKILLVGGKVTTNRNPGFSRNPIHLSTQVRDFSFFGDHNLLEDGNFSCDEMSEFSETVFNNSIFNLGSGSVAPHSFDRNCNRSIMNLDFMPEILSLVESIRGRQCQGTIWGAIARHYSFNLTRLGYVPDSAFTPPRFLVERAQMSEEYFANWSLLSIRNKTLYDRFLVEIDLAEQRLHAWYASNHGLTEEGAIEATKAVIFELRGHAYGSYTSSKSPSAIFSDSMNLASDLRPMLELRGRLLNKASVESVLEILPRITDPTLTSRSETPLSLAIYDIEVLRLLIEKRFDVEHANEFGKTALYYAIEANKYDSVKLLIESGANVNASYNAENNNTREQCHILHWERTPLMHAAQHANLEIVELLVDSGSLIATLDSTRIDAAEYARRAGNTDSARFLESASPQTGQ